MKFLDVCSPLDKNVLSKMVCRNMVEMIVECAENPLFTSLYAELCCNISDAVPSFVSDDDEAGKSMHVLTYMRENRGRQPGSDRK